MVLRFEYEVFTSPSSKHVMISMLCMKSFQIQNPLDLLRTCRRYETGASSGANRFMLLKSQYALAVTEITFL